MHGSATCMDVACGRARTNCHRRCRRSKTKRESEKHRTTRTSERLPTYDSALHLTKQPHRIKELARPKRTENDSVTTSNPAAPRTVIVPELERAPPSSFFGSSPATSLGYCPLPRKLALPWKVVVPAEKTAAPPRNGWKNVGGSRKGVKHAKQKGRWRHHSIFISLPPALLPLSCLVCSVALDLALILPWNLKNKERPKRAVQRT